MASSQLEQQGGDQRETLVASFVLIFEHHDPRGARVRTVEVLASRRVLSLVSEPAPWGELAMVEVHIAVNDEGLIHLAGAEGDTRLGQQVEDFAVALKLGTRALYVAMDDIEVGSGEPIDDERLDEMPPGRTLLAGNLSESGMVIVAGATKTAWKFFTENHGEPTPAAVHQGFLLGAPLSASGFPAVLLSRSGPRFAAAFWFAKQGRKLHGQPAWVHVWPLAAQPALAVDAGTESAQIIEFLLQELGQPDREGLSELTGQRVSQEHVQLLEQVTTGVGTLSAATTALKAFGYPSSLASYLDSAPVPAAARDIQPRGLGATLAAGLTTEEEGARGTRKFFSPLSWKPVNQLLLGLLEAVLLAVLIVATRWDEPWLPAWLLITILSIGFSDALGNMYFGVRRWVYACRRPTG